MKSIILVCCVLVAVGGWAAATAPPAAAAIHLTAPEKAVLALINHARTTRGRHAVRVVASLERGSRAHSRDMLRRGYFSHLSYGGASYANRLRAFGYSTGAAPAGGSARSSVMVAAPRRWRASFGSG